MWQVGLAVVGLAIVAFVLVGPRGRLPTPLVVGPAAEITSGAGQPIPAGQQPSDGQQVGAPASSDGAAGAASGPAAMSNGARAGAALPGLPNLPAVAGVQPVPGVPGLPGVPAVTGAGRTLFLDNFAGDPLGALPAGWQLADPAPSSGGLGAVPIVGSLLGGLTSSGTAAAPSIVSDGAHVLSRPAGSWSHLAAGPVTADSTASAVVRTLGQSSGFVGVAGRFQDVNDSLMCGVRGANTLQLWQVVAGRQQLLASTPVNAAANVFHTIAMSMQGGQVTCSLDGVSLLHAAGTWTSPGRLGLVAVGDVASEFSNVAATALP